MRFLYDVHISCKVQRLLTSQGHDAYPVNQLPDRWDTDDSDICRFADREECIVISKDAEFLDFYLIPRSPKRLVKINLGNISTAELIRLLAKVFVLLPKRLKRERFLVEVDKDGTFTVDQID